MGFEIRELERLLAEQTEVHFPFCTDSDRNGTGIGQHGRPRTSDSRSRLENAGAGPVQNQIGVIG